MRGGRGGRGGGRFGKVSVTQDLVRDNMEDLGMDQRQLMVDMTKPLPLYPPISMQGPTKLNEEDQFSVQKMREITQRFQTSSYFLARKQEEQDIDRYSDKNRKKTTSTASLLECINTGSDDAARYIPFELLDSSMFSTSQAGGAKLPSKRVDRNLTALEQQEKDGGTGARGEKPNEGSDIEEEEEEEVEEDADYGVDHYASDGDNYSGDEGGGEATY